MTDLIKQEQNRRQFAVNQIVAAGKIEEALMAFPEDCALLLENPVSVEAAKILDFLECGESSLDIADFVCKYNIRFNKRVATWLIYGYLSNGCDNLLRLMDKSTIKSSAIAIINLLIKLNDHKKAEESRRILVAWISMRSYDDLLSMEGGVEL